MGASDLVHGAVAQTSHSLSNRNLRDLEEPGDSHLTLVTILTAQARKIRARKLVE